MNVTVAESCWHDSFAPVLKRAFVGARAELALANTIAAIKDGSARLWAALRDDTGECVGVIVFTVQTCPLRALVVVAVAAVPRTGFHWGRAVWPSIVARARAAECSEIRAHALDAANRRRLRLVGFHDDATALVWGA